MFVVANRSTTLTNFYPKGDVKSSTSNSFAGPSFPSQWSAEESAGVVLEGSCKSNFSEQIKIEDSREMIETWEDEEEEDVDDMRAVSDEEEYNGMDNSIDSAVDVQEYDRPKVASFADLGALTGWTLDPEPVETETEKVTVMSSRRENQSRGNTPSAGISVVNKKHDGNGEQKDDKNEDDENENENDDEDEDSGSEYSQEYEEELKDSDKEDEKENKAEVNPTPKQKNNEFEKPSIATGSVSVMNKAESRKDPTVDAAKPHTTDDIEKSLSSLPPAPMSTAQETSHSPSTNFNVIKNDMNALKDHEMEIMGGDSRIHSLNKDFRRVEVEVEVGHNTEKMADTRAFSTGTGSGSRTGTKSGISNATETHTTYVNQTADSSQTTSAPSSSSSSSSYAAASFHYDAEGTSKQPNPYLQGSEQRSVNQPHPTVGMLPTQSANATAARQLQLQLQPQHTLSPVLAPQHRVPQTHSLIPSFSPLAGQSMGSSISAPAPGPAVRSQSEVPFRHNQPNHENNSEGYRYIDEGKNLSYPPPLQYPSYAPSHVPSMPVYPMQSSQQHYPHPHSNTHTSTAQPPHTSHPLSPSHYGSGFPTPHPSYPYYPHPPHPSNPLPFSSSLPYHPSMYPPTHMSAQQSYPGSQSEAADIYHMQTSMPYHNTHQQSHQHPQSHPYPYGLSASTPGLGPTSAGYGMYPHSSSSSFSLPMNDTLPSRHGLSMSGMRPNMNMNMNMNMHGSTDAYNTTQGKAYSGNINGVSGGFNEKKMSNLGVEDLMRDLKEAKVRHST